MTKLFLSVLFLIIWAIIVLNKSNGTPAERRINIVGYLCWGASAILLLMSVVITVPAGHVKVATLFGKVQDNNYREGLHIVNPLLAFTAFDLRQKTHMETAGIPAEDKLITKWMFRFNTGLSARWHLTY